MCMAVQAPNWWAKIGATMSMINKDIVPILGWTNYGWRPQQPLRNMSTVLTPNEFIQLVYLPQNIESGTRKYLTPITYAVF